MPCWIAIGISSVFCFSFFSFQEASLRDTTQNAKGMMQTSKCKLLYKMKTDPKKLYGVFLQWSFMFALLKTNGLLRSFPREMFDKLTENCTESKLNPSSTSP